ncbi:MAG: DNA polymerase III subunit gamma/tau [Polyangiaceae bacterium]|jgi:DNA polymerase-3 subunit gamma/tau|nr:DNA polymerase III subunit gamma/tau [Polyangiaceae bacterium]
MSYVVLARKWRPMTFEDLVGQEHVATTLGNAIAIDRVAHAFLFTGVRGVGKTTSARILAKALNCEKGPTSKPCLECPACKEIAAGVDMDVQEIDAASRTGVDDIRDLQEKLVYRPARDRFKIFIVDEVHMLSQNAWNAFLKTLEEPPPHVKFIFATTEVNKVPVTILSRCQRYDFKLITATTIAARLEHVLREEGIKAEQAAVQLLAREAAGSMRDAMSLLDQVIAWAGGDAGLTAAGVARALGVAESSALYALAKAAVRGDATMSLTRAVELGDAGFDVGHMTRDLLALLRDVVCARVAPDARALLAVPDAELDELRSIAGLAPADDLSRIYLGFAKSTEEILQSPLPRASFEMAIVRMATRPPLVPVDELVRRLVDLEARLEGRPVPRPDREPPPPAQAQRPAATREARASEERTRATSGEASEDPGPPPAPGDEVAQREVAQREISATPAPPVAARPEAPLAARPEAATREPEPPPLFSHDDFDDEPPPPDEVLEAPPPSVEPAPPISFEPRGSLVFEPPPMPASVRAAEPFTFKPPSLPPPASAALPLRSDPPPPSRRPGLAPILDATHPGFAVLADLADAVRAKSGRLASVLERAALVEATEHRLVLGFEARSFEAGLVAEPQARVLIASMAVATLGPGAAVELVDVASGDEVPTLAKMVSEAVRARRDAIDRSIRTHPLVVAAVEHLGAEIRDVRLPKDAESTIISLHEARERAG